MPDDDLVTDPADPSSEAVDGDRQEEEDREEDEVVVHEGWLEPPPWCVGNLG